MELEPFEIFKVLSGETRIKIINILKNRGPLGAKEIAARIGLTPAAISQHLKILRHSGILKRQRKGYWIPYSLNEETLECCRQELNQVCECKCYESCEAHEHDSNHVSLESLENYKKELEEKLLRIRKRIEEIKLKTE